LSYILFPCHLVIGKNNTLTGFRGGLAIKEMLLRLEGVHSVAGIVPIARI
jgi:O6-methylguanine-DNA--protein-cysteine methyltransferase